MRTILLGEAPGRGHDDQPAFSSRSGQFLSDLIGQDVREALDCQNLLQKWPGRSAGKGALFPQDLARISARRFLEEVPQDARVIFAGQRVVKAFGFRKLPPLEWVHRYVGARFWCALLPHPSGVNRWWNDPEHLIDARLFLLAEIERMK